MDLERLERMAISLRRELKKHKGSIAGFRHPVLYAGVENLITLFGNTFPEHKVFSITFWKRWDNEFLKSTSEAISMINYILEHLEFEKSAKSKAIEMRIFESANEKIEQASLSFTKEDYASVINNLNTALELMLKDKLGIPTTIRKINTTKIIDICVKHKIDPYFHLSEAKRHIVEIANQVKHRSYRPLKKDCIMALKAIEELRAKLRGMEMELTEDVRNKIYGVV